MFAFRFDFFLLSGNNINNFDFSAIELIFADRLNFDDHKRFEYFQTCSKLKQNRSTNQTPVCKNNKSENEKSMILTDKM